MSKVRRLLASLGLNFGSLLIAVAFTVGAYLGSAWALTHSKLSWIHQGDTTVASSALAAAVFAACWEISRRLTPRTKQSSLSKEDIAISSFSFVNNLPAEPAGFTGRDEDVAKVLNSLRLGSSARPLLVTAGVGGIGKTALALHCAHQGLRRGMFPGGVLFINLQGYGETELLAPQAALYSFLRLLGVVDEQIPQETADRSSLYRALLAQRAKAGMRTLLVLDNAEHLAQVEPLLPGGSENPTLITTRETFPTLAARQFNLDIIPVSDAVQLLNRQLQVAAPTDPRLEANLADMERVALACGCLPLALLIAAAILRGDPYLSIPELAEELAPDVVLERLAVGANEAIRSPSQVFTASYLRLNELDARTFRILGGIPGLTVSATAVLAVTPGISSLRQANESLTRLQQVHLVSRDIGSGRWQIHDLVRRFAADLLAAPERKSERIDTIESVVEYYSATTRYAAQWTNGRGAQESGNIFSSEDEAFAYLNVEKGSAIECVRISLRNHLPFYAWLLAIQLDGYLNACRDLAAAVEVLELACEAANQFVPIENEMLAIAHNRLGWALREVGRYAQASQNHRLAAQYAEADHLVERQCIALEYLGVSLWHEEKNEAALAVFEQVIELAQGNDDLADIRAMAINDTGLCYRSSRRFDEAIAAHEEGVKINTELGRQSGVAVGLCNIGRALIAANRPSEAIPALRKSIITYDSLGRIENYHRALAISALGRAYRGDRQPAKAHECFAEALQFFVESKDLKHQATVYRELGRTEWKFTKARHSYEASIKLYLQLDSAAERQEVEQELAKLSRVDVWRRNPHHNRKVGR